MGPTRRHLKWEWDDPVYKVHIILSLQPWPEVCQWMKRRYNAIGSDVGLSLGRTIRIHAEHCGLVIVLWFPSDHKFDDEWSLSTLVHECLHATDYILADRGLILTDDSVEAYTYHQAWMFRECYRRLKKS